MNRDLISYEEFCSDLEKASTGSTLDASRSLRRAGNRYADRTVHSTSIRHSSHRNRVSPRDDFSDVDDVPEPFAHRNVSRWYTREASPKQRREFDNVFESLESFRQSHASDAAANRRGSGGAVPGINLDRIDEFAPKVSDSIRLGGAIGVPSPTRSRYSRYGGNSFSMESPRLGDSVRFVSFNNIS